MKTLKIALILTMLLLVLFASAFVYQTIEISKIEKDLRYCQDYNLSKGSPFYYDVRLQECEEQLYYCNNRVNNYESKYGEDYGD